MKTFYLANNKKSAVMRGRMCCGCSNKMKGGNVPLLLEKNHGFGIVKDTTKLRKTLQEVKLERPKSKYISI